MSLHSSCKQLYQEIDCQFFSIDSQVTELCKLGSQSESKALILNRLSPRVQKTHILNNDCCTSIDKASQFLYDLSGGKLKISKGMINKLCKSFADKSGEQFKNAFDKLLSSPVMHIDCTNADVNGAAAYVFVCAAPNGEMLYFARKKKGHEGVKGTVAEDYQGILVHDHESTFNKYGTAHQDCLAHVSRYLQDSIDNEPSLTWNAKMKSLIGEMLHYRNGIPEDGTLDAEKVADFERRYADIIELAKKEYEASMPGKYGYRDGYNLLKRMDEQREKHLLFLHDMRVPGTNNMSERLLREFKRKQVQATVFRCFENLSHLCKGMSVLKLLRQKDGANLFEEVKRIFES